MYIPLHVHTEYSVLDGMSTVAELCKRAKELGLPGIAITDHGNMMGVKTFHSYFKSQAPEIKPILGVEAYITDNYDCRIKDPEHKRTFHIILLAKNITGYRNLCKITTLGATEGLYKKPRIDLSVLRRYHEGIICMTACIGGEVPQCILDDDIAGAEAAIGRYREIFGEDFYLEVSIHPNDREGNPQEVLQWQRKTAEAMYALGDKFGIKVVATNDSHFTYKEQAEAHDVMLAVNCKKLLSDTTRLRYTGEEYLKSEQEMLSVFSGHPEVVWNTMEVFEKVEYYDLDMPVSVPLPKTIPPSADCDRILAEHAREGFKKFYSEDDTEAKNRLEWELEVISKYGFSKNFLVMEDIIRFARSRNITYGPGRGAAVGSLVNYCLEITGIDPIKNSLIFERFINPGQCKSFPGIDFDFEQGGVTHIWHYLQETYGVECVAGQVSLQRQSIIQMFRKVTEALGIPKKKCKPVLDIMEKEGFCSWHNGKDLTDLLDADADLHKAYRIATELRDRISGSGTHSCAILVSTCPMSDCVPLMTGDAFASEERIPLVQYEWWHAEDAGLFKVNFLELRTLNVIQDTINEINADTPDKVDITDITDDLDTNILMYMGDKTGVFLFESEIMKKELRKFPYCPKFKHLLDVNSLCRPTLMSRLKDYRNWKEGDSADTGIPELDVVLEETNGVLIYHEQLIRFFEMFLGKTTGESVTAFKAIFKRKKTLPALKEEFMAEGRRWQYPETKMEGVWDYLLENGMYTILKSHYFAYTTLAYRCAFLKSHYPEIFMRNHKRYNAPGE